MSRSSYFWKDGEVFVVNEVMFARLAKEMGCEGLYCVDTHRTDPSGRYGEFKNIPGQFGWKHIPLEQFPPEFRMRLLLLGVT